MSRSEEKELDQPFPEIQKNVLLVDNLDSEKLLKFDEVVEHEHNRAEKKRSRTYAFIIFWIVLATLIVLYITGYVLHIKGIAEYTLLNEICKYLQYIGTTLIGYLFGTRISKD